MSSRVIIQDSKIFENKNILQTIIERPVTTNDTNLRKFPIKRKNTHHEEQLNHMIRPMSCDLRIKKIKKIEIRQYNGPKLR